MALNDQCEVKRFRRFAVIRAAGIGAFFIAAAGASWFAADRLEAHHRNAADAVAELQQYQRRQDEVRAEVGRLSDSKSTMLAEINALRERLPPHPDEARAVAAISGIATERNLEIQSVRPARADGKDALGMLNLHLAATGSYETICRFLDRVAAMPRVCRVTDLTLSADEYGETVRAEMTLCFLFGRPAGESTL